MSPRQLEEFYLLSNSEGGNDMWVADKLCENFEDNLINWSDEWRIPNVSQGSPGFCPWGFKLGYAFLFQLTRVQLNKV